MSCTKYVTRDKAILSPECNKIAGLIILLSQAPELKSSHPGLGRDKLEVPQTKPLEHKPSFLCLLI